MYVTTPWMLITGCAIVGWLLPETFAAIMNRPISFLMNILGALAAGLISGAFVG